MKLSGSLERTTLGDLLGALHRDRADGVLELTERNGVTAGRSHRVRVVRGLVQAVETALGVPKLGEILRSEGFISPMKARWLTAALARSPQLRTGDLLVRSTDVSPEVVAAALRYQLRARLDAVFALGSAAIRFHVASSRLRDEPDIVPLSPREFLHGRPRHRDTAKSSRDASRSRSARPPRRDAVRARALTTLGLDAGADRDAVQRAFRKLASRFHPDRHPRATGGEKAELMKRFAEVSAAYHQLVA